MWGNIMNKTLIDINNCQVDGKAKRHNSNKPDLSLIPLCLLEDEARVWQHGATKYEKNNWMRGQKWSIPLASAFRHLAKWQAGQDMDDESGESHIAHAIANLHMITLYMRTYKDGDDRCKCEYYDAD